MQFSVFVTGQESTPGNPFGRCCLELCWSINHKWLLNLYSQALNVFILPINLTTEVRGATSGRLFHHQDATAGAGGYCQVNRPDATIPV